MSGDGRINRWANRIVGYDQVDPEQLLGNPLNARVHPRKQQIAVESILDRLGWIQNIIVNRSTGFLVDGHLRVMRALDAGEATVPVAYVELTDEEERLAISFYDATAGMAVLDPSILAIATDDLDMPESLTALRGDLLGDTSSINDAAGLSDVGSDDKAPPPDNLLQWGYTSFGSTRCQCSSGEIDQLQALYEGYRANNGGLHVGFVEWLVASRAAETADL